MTDGPPTLADGPVEAGWRARVAAGDLKNDAGQAEAARRLDALAARMAPAPAVGLARLFRRRRPAGALRGLYLWGGTGRGKTMLTDLFLAEAGVQGAERRHFHAFMLDVHAAMHQARAAGAADPLAHVAAAWGRRARLLALDEMQVTNVADAMILGRLLAALGAEGVSLLTTSNRAPADLYRDGLNRELFLPAIARLQADCEVHAIGGAVDHRLERIAGLDAWHVPNGPEATARLREAFFRMTDRSVDDAASVPSVGIEVDGGRTLFVPKSLAGVAVFSFKRLCGQPLGAADYLALARSHHTLVLVGVPVMDEARRNEAIRFLALIDTIYDWRVKLFAAADAQPEGLYTGRTQAFEFQRAVSRLHEMRSAAYRAEGHGLQAGASTPLTLVGPHR